MAEFWQDAALKRLWAEEEDRALTELRKQGRKMHEIGAALGRSTMSVGGWIDTLNKTIDGPPTKKTRKARGCIRCHATFMSDGSGHRHCNPCREWLAEAA
ncbi:hypothetical protein [Rhizobium leguminosarum]|uniref:hypothetical protein n=1 Tax=Rhizobium leguminosarum TaxID=384 RepID=UPI0004B2C834|nr:hypothetical protein [Rhizobium leguminosarum]WFT86872.1 hypothetical protein QA638_04435 [Rhizobium leguminosarum]